MGVIATIQRYGDNELRIETSEYHGKRNVSVREWFKGDRGDMLPSKKGISLKPAELGAVIEALQDAQAECEGGDRPVPRQNKSDGNFTESDSSSDYISF